MAAFQFPDPALETTVTNPITGSTYQWKEPPGKWVVTVKMRDVGDIIWEGDNPPDPIGDYKLWYSTDTLELYFYYCDAGGTCAWVPTSVPIQVLEDLNTFAVQAEVDIDQLQYKQQLLQNALDQIYLEQTTQNDEIERVERESKIRDLILELEILYFKNQGKNCSVYKSATYRPEGPPFSTQNFFSASDKVVKVTKAIYEGIQPEVGQTLEFSGANIPNGWSSKITAVGDGYQPATGHLIYDITVEDTIDPIITDAIIGSVFDMAACQPSAFVLKKGDTMTGSLVMEDAGRLELSNTNLRLQTKGESLKDSNGDPVLDSNNNEQWDPAVSRFRQIKSAGPRLTFSDDTTSAYYGGLPFGVEVDLDDGYTYQHQWRFKTRDGHFLSIHGGTGPMVSFAKGFPGNQNPNNGDPNWAAGDEGGVKIRGIPTPAVENPDGSLAVNKQYVDTRDEELRQDIIELEEELEAIAPSLERGLWVFNPIGGAGVGQYGLFALGTPTSEYPQADHLFINSVDKDGKVHNFGDVKQGTYLEIFSPTDGDFGLYQIIENNGETQGANSYWDFTLDHIQSNRLLADAEGACRFKFFELAEGADPETFVLKRGDTMTGDLEITVDPDSSDEKAAALILEGRRTTATESCATVSFRNENVTETNTNGYLTYRSFGNNQSFKFNKDLRIEGNVTASNELRGTVLNSAQDSNLSIQRDNETKILVGSDAVQVQRPIKFVNSSFATDDNHAIHKGYVDEQIAKVGGGADNACVLVNGGRLCADLPPPTWMYYINEGTWTQHRVQNFSATALYVPSLDLRLYRDHAPNPYGGALKSWKLSDGYDTSKAVNVWLRNDWPSGLAALTDDGRYFSCVLPSTMYGATGTKRFEIDVKDLDHYDSTNSRLRYNSTTFNEMPKWLSCVYDKDDLFIGTSRFDNYTSCYFIYNQAGSSTVSYDNAQDILALSGSAHSNTDPHVSRIGDEVYCTTRTTKWVWRYAGSKTWEKLENVELPIADVIEILYLDEVKRYVLIGPNGTSNWISQITEGPIDRNTFRGAIEMKHPDFEPVPGQTVSPHSSWYLPIVVHGEVIMQGNAGKKTINGVEYTHGTCYTTFDGHSVKHYLGDATNSGKADYNKEDSRGTAYRGWNHVGKSMSVTLENNKLTPATGYADTLDLEVEVPYVQKLYWNGELLHPPLVAELFETRAFSWSGKPERRTTAWTSAPIGTDSQGELTSNDYPMGVWFPMEWLKNNYYFHDLPENPEGTYTAGSQTLPATTQFRMHNGIEGVAVYQATQNTRNSITITFNYLSLLS